HVTAANAEQPEGHEEAASVGQAVGKQLSEGLHGSPMEVVELVEALSRVQHVEADSDGAQAGSEGAEANIGTEGEVTDATDADLLGSTRDIEGSSMAEKQSGFEGIAGPCNFGSVDL
ncbi:unnamed protein product, partial [Prorocentrum cordatum]